MIVQSKLKLILSATYVLCECIWFDSDGIGRCDSGQPAVLNVQLCRTAAERTKHCGPITRSKLGNCFFRPEKHDCQGLQALQNAGINRASKFAVQFMHSTCLRARMGKF
jgi:hypothetical protein